MLNQYSIAALSKEMNAQLYGDGSRTISFLLTDSRKLSFPESTLFFAIKSQRNDGHKYLDALYGQGVRAFVISDPNIKMHEDASYLLVEDVIEALHHTAYAHRRKLALPVLAITGSNGKTTVKEWLYHLIHEEVYVVRSPKSFNSKIGVPLTLWQIRDSHELAIIECGISLPNEMVVLEKVVRPTMGLITNIGGAHSEGFESDHQKLLEKLKLFKSCDVIYLNGNDHFIHQEVKKLYPNKVLKSWSSKKDTLLSDVHFMIEGEATHATLSYKGQRCKLEIPFIDQASVENVMMSVLVALDLGLHPDKIIDRVRTLRPLELRLDINEGVKGARIIRDFYNSDPESVLLSLDFMEHQKVRGPRTLVLSSFDQIRIHPDLYPSIVRVINQKNLDKVVLIGQDWKGLEKQIKAKSFWYETTQGLIDNIELLTDRDALVLLKGARRFKFEELSRIINAQLHTTFMEVSLTSLVSNLNAYRSLLKRDTKVMAMVKAFGYGSGSSDVASVLQFNRVDYLGVAYLEEGVGIREAGIQLPIMVMNPQPEGFERLIKYYLEPEIYSMAQLDAFESAVLKHHVSGEPYPIHIKLETGMNRLGFTHDQIEELIERLGKFPKLKVMSVFSHLAAADDAQFDEFTQSQIDNFNRSSTQILEALDGDVLRHLLNSSGVVRFTEAQFDMVRLGLGLYGVDPSQEMTESLNPVSSLKTCVSQVKKVFSGESVGYGRNFLAKKEVTVATLPIGYADGLMRSLGNGKGEVFVNGKRCPIIGNICMDMTMIDVTEVDVQTGDEVELFGEHISIKELADWAGTIPYEIMVRIGRRVPRIYKED